MHPRLKPILAHSNRTLVLGGPRGYLTVIPADHVQFRDRYAGWEILAVIHRPFSRYLAEAGKAWALRRYAA